MAEPPQEHHDAIADNARGQTDAANKSLADALQVSFALLKVAMVVLLVIYLGSGVFRVEGQRRAVQLIFGEIAKDENGNPKVLDPGFYIGWPYPIGEVVQVPVTSQSLEVNQAFWFEVQDQDLGKDLSEIAANYANRPLNPEKDGSLLTGDANIVMGRYSVVWKITKPDLFIENVGLVQTTELTVGTPNSLSRAQDLVRSAVERAIVHSVAEVEADGYIGGRTNATKAVTLAQQTLDSLRTGITVERITASKHIAPPSVLDAFQAVTNAESERAKKINEARQESARTLGETAGAATDALISLIEKFEFAYDAGKDEEAEALKQQIDKALVAKAVTVDDGKLIIGGAVAERINQAETYRSRISEQVAAEANSFNLIYNDVFGSPDQPEDKRPTPEQSRQRLTILTNRLWQDMREKVLKAEGVETIYADTQNIRVDITGDPKIQREREERALEAAREAARTQDTP